MGFFYLLPGVALNIAIRHLEKRKIPSELAWDFPQTYHSLRQSRQGMSPAARMGDIFCRLVGACFTDESRYFRAVF